VFEQDSPLMRFLYPILASVAGAVTALSFRPFKGLTAGQIALAVFVGFSFAFFTGPLAVRAILGANPDARMQGVVYYLLASGQNALIPLAIKWLGRGAGFQAQEPEK
jgi:hypothetical protein